MLLTFTLSIVMQSQISLSLAQPGAQETNKVPHFVTWTSSLMAANPGGFSSSPFWVCQDSWECLCPTFPLVSKYQQAQTLPEALAFPLPSALRVQTVVCLAPSRNSACYCLPGKHLSRGWRDQRGVFTQRQSYLFHVFNYLTVVVVSGGLGWRGGEGVGQKKARSVETKQP